MHILLVLAGMALVYGLVGSFLTTIAVLLGLLLHAIMPSLGLGSAVVAGSVLSVGTTFFFGTVTRALAERGEEDIDFGEGPPIFVLPRDASEVLPRRKRRRKQ